MGYRIKTVASLVGVPRNTLLAWERRYGLVAPERLPNGYREYTEADVARLRELKALIDRGHAVGEAVRLLQSAPPPPPAPDPPTPGHAPLREALHAALVQGDLRAAAELARRLEPLPYERRLHDVIFPVLRRVGDAWERGEITVAQEHLASQWLRSHMGEMLSALGHGPPGGPPTVCAGYPHEAHDLGLLGAAIERAMAGDRVTWLGPDVPLDDLVAWLQAAPPARVCTSVVMAVPVPELQAWVDRVRAALPPTAEVLVGGRGVRDLPPLAGAHLVPPTAAEG